MSAKRRPKKRKTAPPTAEKKPSKPENDGGLTAPRSASTQPRPAKSAPNAAFRFFDAGAGASRLKTPKFVSKNFNAFSQELARLFDGPARPKTPRQEADDRQARFVAGVAALAFVVGVVFFFAGKSSRRLDPPSTSGAATVSTPQKLADAVAAEVEKERSNAKSRRAVVETSAKTAAVEPAPPAETLAFVVELNSASKAELKNLPRVGEKLAERIIERREELGGFRSVDDLLDVKGIGEKTLEKMRPYCVVAPHEDAE